MAALLWSATRAASDGAASGLPEPVSAALDPSPVAPAAIEEPLPVILPYVPPPPVERPHLASQEKSPPSDNPQRAAPRDAPAPVSQPSPSPHPPPPAATPPLPATAPAGKPSLSYKFYWGLAELPFENVPDPKFYFPTAMHEEALHRLLYGVQTRKGAVMLTGEIGCGKTLLSRELSLHLSDQQYDVAVIANPNFGTDDFLTEVLYQLGIEPTKTKVKLLHLLNERLLDNYKRGRQTVLVIDEAQTIQDNQIFEELRLLLNFQLNDRFLLTLVLMGQPELNDRMMTLKQFAQRISIKYHLGYFSAQQTTEYVRFRLKAAKCTKEVFTEDALDFIFKQSGGVPRNINTICDLCLLIGSMDRAAGVDRQIVERATAERGQLGLF
jgi:general secretion pathway protein A